MKEFMLLRFQDAVLFRNNIKTKDKLFLGPKDKGEPRKGFPQFESYLTHHQISNVLHVLFNERPVPFFGACVYKKQERLVEKAKNSFLKLNVSTWVTKEGKQKNVTEFYQTRKPFYNSNAKINHLTWDLIQQHLSEHYEPFVEMLKIATNHPNPRGLSVEEVPVVFQKSDKHKEKEALLDYLKDRKNGKTGVFHWLREESELYKNKPLEMAKDTIAKGLRLVVGSGIDKTTIRLSGTLIVPLDEEDKEILKNSSGVATVLDGGLVWIEQVVPGNRLSAEGYQKVGDISTKLITS